MIAIKGYDHVPSTCAVCPFMQFDDRTDEPYCTVEAVANVELSEWDFNVKRHDNCPLREVKTMKWNHLLSKEEVDWSKVCPDISSQSLQCQAGNAFVKEMINDKIVKTEINYTSVGPDYSAYLSVVKE